VSSTNRRPCASRRGLSPDYPKDFDATSSRSGYIGYASETRFFIDKSYFRFPGREPSGN